jgi:hypothetical protein
VTKSREGRICPDRRVMDGPTQADPYGDAAVVKRTAAQTERLARSAAKNGRGVLQFPRDLESRKVSSQARRTWDSCEARSHDQQRRECGGHTSVLCPVSVDTQPKILATLGAAVLGLRRCATEPRYVVAACTDNGLEMTVIAGSKAQNGARRHCGTGDRNEYRNYVANSASRDPSHRE